MGGAKVGWVSKQTAKLNVLSVCSYSEYIGQHGKCSKCSGDQDNLFTYSPIS